MRLLTDDPDAELEFLDHCFDLLQQLSRAAGDEEVIRIPHQMHFGFAALESFDVTFQYPLGRMLAIQHISALNDRVRPGTERTEPIGITGRCAFRDGFQGQQVQVQCLHRPVPRRRNT